MSETHKPTYIDYTHTNIQTDLLDTTQWILPTDEHTTDTHEHANEHTEHTNEQSKHTINTIEHTENTYNTLILIINNNFTINNIKNILNFYLFLQSQLQLQPGSTDTLTAVRGSIELNLSKNLIKQQTNSQSDTQNDTQTDRQTGTQTDRQQTNKMIDNKYKNELLFINFIDLLINNNNNLNINKIILLLNDLLLLINNNNINNYNNLKEILNNLLIKYEIITNNTQTDRQSDTQTDRQLNWLNDFNESNKLQYYINRTA